MHSSLLFLCAGVALSKTKKEHKWEAEDSDSESLYTEKSLELRQVWLVALFLLFFLHLLLFFTPCCPFSLLLLSLLVGLLREQCQGWREECSGADN